MVREEQGLRSTHQRWPNNLKLSEHISRVPTRHWKYWKSIELQIGVQDLEKVLNLAKMCIRYWKSVEVLYGKEISSIWAEFCWRQSNSIFMQCVKSSFMIKNFEKWREVMILNLWNLVLKRFKKGTGKIIFLNVCEPWVPDLDNYNFFSFSKLELTWDQTQLSQIRLELK